MVQRGVAFGFSKFRSPNGAVERRCKSFHAGFGRGAVDLANEHVEACSGVYFGDTSAHQPASDNANASNVRVRGGGHGL
jgi:hypothetical protein